MMIKPTTEEIRERHNKHRSDSDAHIDRSILLDKLEAAELKLEAVELKLEIVKHHVNNYIEMKGTVTLRDALKEILKQDNE